ncbi:MAG: hypothetical protein ABIH03_08295 [Pseudomonadota bacterium]
MSEPNYKAIVGATAKANGKLYLPDGHKLVNVYHGMGQRWIIYTPEGSEIHYAADSRAEPVAYPSWEQALTGYEGLMAEDAKESDAE